MSNHLVYKITFTNRRDNNIVPYQYIGSKSNAIFIDGVIRTVKGVEYCGSSSDVMYINLIKSNEPRLVELLYECGDYSTALQKEREYHEALDVVSDISFFNKSVASICTYSSPDYGTYRHTTSNKCVRLPKKHQKVKSGEYVNVNCGMKTYNNGIVEKQFFESDSISDEWSIGRLDKNKLKGVLNPFFGKKHSTETVNKISTSLKLTYANDIDKFQQMRNATSIRMSSLHKGVPKTIESNLKRARYGYVMLKNIETNECVRVQKKDLPNYDVRLWRNPYSIRSKKYGECPHCHKFGELNTAFKKWHFKNCKLNKGIE